MARSIADEAKDLERLLSRRDLRRLFPVSDMTIWRWQQSRGFPPPMKIGGRNFWREHDVSTWIQSFRSVRPAAAAVLEATDGEVAQQKLETRPQVACGAGHEAGLIADERGAA